MSRSPISWRRAASPDSMPSIRLLPRQWRFVGKLTINRGPASPFRNEHSSGKNFIPVAGFPVCLEVVGERLLELKRGSTAHHANAIDRVDQCIGLIPDNVSARKPYHHKSSCINNATLEQPRRQGGDSDHTVTASLLRPSLECRLRSSAPDSRETGSQPGIPPVFLP